MKKTVLACVIALIVLAPVFSQDADQVSRILAKESATCIDFAYLAASQTGMECTPFEAWTFCDRFGTFAFDERANRPASAKGISHFLMLNYGIDGGILWSTFRNARYAWKELKATGFWEAGTDPDENLSGRELVRTMNRFFTLYPDARLRNPPTGEAEAGRKNALLAIPEAAK